mgnify:CR=1 FL=1
MGRAGAELCARHGAHVCVVDYNAEGAESVAASIRAAGGEATSITADLTDMTKASDIVSEAVQAMGGIDGLWAHAGSASPKGIEHLDSAEYERFINLNVHGTVATVSAAVPHLRASGGGAILMTASTSGLVGSLMSPIYSMAKFGIVGLGKSLAISLGEYGIRVNVICPGTIETPMLPTFMPDAVRDSYVSTLPLRRIGDAVEVGQAALWLLSDEASYVTGIALPVDGGYTAR